ncbi:MAG: hypothetical protein HY908_19265 [Myxococcales bacterium]|nr:hypothetical protein [Myxococcales bacterium]
MNRPGQELPSRPCGRASRRVRALWVASACVAALVAGAACESSDPVARGPSGLGGGAGAAGVCDANAGIEDVSGPSCAPLADDYTPRDEGSSTDAWPACISDANAYVPFDASIASLARVAAFEEIGALLAFGGARAPTAQDFLDARVVYTALEGIESRVVRREDEHYPPAPKLCRDMTPEEQAAYPDRCVGPVRIRPILNDAFQEGIAGVDPVGNAARIEAALVWFFYVSIYKEATTAADKAADVDSMWAKYTGGEPRESAFGLSRFVLARSREAHDRIWDGLLAVRCWRDLDHPTGVATDLALRDRARAQLDRALLRGLAVLVRQRVAALDCLAAWESVKILGGVLDREATVRDPARAALLRAELGKARPEDVDRAAVTAALDAVFPCP